MRVYVPLTLPGLADAHRQGEVGGGPLTAYAVTPALRAWCGSDDVEELEYAALGEAARSSLRLLAATPGAAPRRVVLALDVPDATPATEPDPGGEPGALRLSGPFPMRRAAAVHLDAEAAEAAVTAAVAALSAARGGTGAAGDAAGETADDVAGGAEAHELLWYAVQEIDALV
ncbi:hypothetical protein QNO07_10695 [Streptomyces sp. 549]|uniref:DUF6912 family protein n=1 Tax=Streptomyces sp. 549 TaxID=3049076 RepID=UPI0024C2D87D|nr:hypothetical protein [Streptomyces sp. 549]MDK1473880.1 hypothetical protein [Streptomyces sp. 549]